MTRVAVCVCTYRRPASLERLLRSLADQRFAGEAPDVEIVIVDNDGRESARPVVQRWVERLPWPVRYVVEPDRGIPAARNRAVSEVAGSAEVIAFVDDDEWVVPGWLSALLDGLDRYDAGVATGPRLPVYPEGVPEWVPRGRFFQGPRRPTGTEVDVAYTHNVALRSEVLDGLDRWFDEDLAFQGGSDTDLFCRIRERGVRFVWLEEAVVFEPVPLRRARGRWLLRRFYRFGATAARVPGKPAVRLARAARALGRTALSPLRLAGLPYEGRGALLRVAMDWAFSAGFVAGLLGFGIEEYRRRRYPEDPEDGRTQDE